jgi:hypothetical protein
MIATELSGISADGKVVELWAGMLVLAVVKVITPDEPALYAVTGAPLKLKVKGMV